MNILAINASYRGSRGVTAALVDRLLAGAAEAGAVTERVDLANLDLKHCIDCQRCQSADHFLRCVLHDDMDALYAKMRNADLIVFATPVYTFAMGSLLRLVLERYYHTAQVKEFSLTKSGLFFHNVDGRLCAKPFALVAVCDNMMEATPRNVIDYFRTYAEFMDAPMVGTLVRTSAALLRTPGPEADRIFAAYGQAGRELATNGRIGRQTARRSNADLLSLPFFVRWSWFRRLLAASPGARRTVAEHHRRIMGAAVNS